MQYALLLLPVLEHFHCLFHIYLQVARLLAPDTLPKARQKKRSSVFLQCLLLSLFHRFFWGSSQKIAHLSSIARIISFHFLLGAVHLYGCIVDILSLFEIWIVGVREVLQLSGFLFLAAEGSSASRSLQPV